MDRDLAKIVNIYLSVDVKTINSYFNSHDPSPLYKRQLNHLFEEYIMASVENAKRHSVIFYKMKCVTDIEKKYSEPLIYAVKNHFSNKKKIRDEEFSRFKRRNLILLALSFILIVFCQGILPAFFKHEAGAQSVILTSLDVLSWVILWRPIDTLIFEWNPHLKEISLLNKLATAEVIIVESEKASGKMSEGIMKIVSQTA